MRKCAISIGNYGIKIPSVVATKLGNAVALLYSDTDKALAIQKSAAGGFQVRQIGKIKSTRSVYCKGLIEAKKIKKGRYTTQWDEKDQINCQDYMSLDSFLFFLYNLRVRWSTNLISNVAVSLPSLEPCGLDPFHVYDLGPVPWSRSNLLVALRTPQHCLGDIEHASRAVIEWIVVCQLLKVSPSPIGAPSNITSSFQALTWRISKN